MLLKNLILGALLVSFVPLAHAMEPEEPKNQSSIQSQKREYAEYQDTEVNFMWLNKTFNSNQKGLFPNETQEKNISILTDWATKNADLNFPSVLWYNSKTTPKEQVENTQTTLNSLLKGLKEFKFRDIWEIDYVKAHPNAFTDQDIYFLADLARMAVLLRPTEAKYVIYTDLNVPAFSIPAMPTDEKMKVLGGGGLPSDIISKYGFALPKNNAFDMKFAYENAFFVFDSKHAIARQALQFGILDINTLRGESFAVNNSWGTWDEKQGKLKSQIVFTSFPAMMKYYKYLKGEYGIGADPDPVKMPETLEGKISKFKSPLEVFGLEDSNIKQTCQYAVIKTNRDYVGYRLADTIHPQHGPVDHSGYVNKTTRQLCIAPEESLRDLTIQVNKPQSSFYNR